MQQHQSEVRGGMRIESIAPVRNGAVVTCTPYTLRFAVLLTVANSFLDAHTYLVRGGVFANLQTGNVIFFAIHLAERHWGDSLSRLWPMFAFIAGVVLSSHIKSGSSRQSGGAAAAMDYGEPSGRPGRVRIPARIAAPQCGCGADLLVSRHPDWLVSQHR
jgi:hypothetical protein